jgi:hypothetical protein
MIINALLPSCWFAGLLFSISIEKRRRRERREERRNNKRRGAGM